MIDIENELRSRIIEALKSDYPKLEVSSVYTPTPASFPALSVVESNNQTLRQYADSGSQEQIVSVSYDVNIYSNKTSGRRAECKKIASLVDTVFINLGFNRSLLEPVQNLADSTIYRMVGRYSAKVNRNKEIFGG